MAIEIPPSLKSADVSRFALRAAQLERMKPAVAYWCYYWMTSQIIRKNLQKVDSASRAFTATLMDKLEEMKLQHGSDSTISTDEAGRQYITNFGLETFHRAENAQQANKVTKQTAEAFQASATFLDLQQIWGPLDPETASKSKFAKYHALRIARALKAGEDPNLSNPVIEPNVDDIPLDPNDPEVQMITGAAKQPSVEEVPDEQDTLDSNRALLSPFDQPTQSATSPNHYVAQSPSAGIEDKYAKQSTITPSVDREQSIGGGYFPDVPVSEPPPLSSYDIESDAPTAQIKPATADSDPQSFYAIPHVPVAHQPPPTQSNHYASRQQNSEYLNAAQPPTSLRDDEDAIIDAQKHAKWAMSALNFEDVSTAVKELRLALQALGAQ